MSSFVADEAAPAVSSPQNVEVNTTGITVLASSGSNPLMDIVLIHGLQGHPRDTWTKVVDSKIHTRSPPKLRLFSRSRDVSQEVFADTQKEVFWPEDLLPVDFPEARIMTYGYDSHISRFFKGSANQNNIMTLGENLLHGLVGKRNDTYGRRIIFIVHSLGGIVLKEALRRSRGAMDQEADLQDIYNSTFAIIFFGTPHRGKDYSNIGLTAANIARATGFDVNKKLLSTLSIDSEYLRLLREEFSKMLESRHWQVQSFQEAYGFTNIPRLHDKVVSHESSSLEYGPERRQTIEANHVQMCRFFGAKDPHYIQAREVIIRFKKTLNEISTAQAQDCLDSLCIPQIRLRPLDDMTDAFSETLNWLFKPDPMGPGFVEWLRGDECIFWVQGKPGAGKSTAMKHIFASPMTLASLNGHDSKTSKGWVIIGSFFHDRGTQIQRSLDGILHSMLWQILQRFPRLVQVILQIEELQAPRANDKTFPGTVSYLWTTSNLKRALFCVLQQKLPKQVCFIVDALDEYEGNYSEMVVFLERLVAEGHPANVIKLCAASRPYNPFKDGFRGRPTLDMKDWTRGDIMRYVNGRLRSHYCILILLDNEASDITEGIRSQLESLINEIIVRASGVFLWVRLVVEQLLEELSAGANIRDLQRYLETFPEDLDEFYTHLFMKIPRHDRLEAYVMLASVFCAREPLKPAQLDLIVRLAFGRLSVKDNHPRTSEWLVSTAPNMERRITHCCRGLLEVQDGKVQMLHQTVKEYFSNSNAFESLLGAGSDTEILIPTTNLVLIRSPNAGHIFILQLCLHCVQCPCETLPLSTNGFAGCESAYQWIDINIQTEFKYHAPRISTIDEYSLSLLDDIDICMRSHTCSERTGWLRPVFTNASASMHLLQFAVWKDMKSYVRAKLEDNPTCAIEEPLLHFAIQGIIARDRLDYGHRGVSFEMFDILLSKGASVTRSSPWVVRVPPGDLVSVFTANGVSGSIPCPCTPIQCIDYRINAKALIQARVIDYLIDHGADPDSTVHVSEEQPKARYEPLLHAVVSTGLKSSIKCALVEKLCDKGAKVTVTNEQGLTVLETVQQYFSDISAAAFTSLLARGARISARMLVSPVQFDNFTWRDMDKKEWYERSARLAARKYHPEWSPLTLML